MIAIQPYSTQESQVSRWEATTRDEQYKSGLEEVQKYVAQMRLKVSTCSLIIICMICIISYYSYDSPFSLVHM